MTKEVLAKLIYDWLEENNNGYLGDFAFYNKETGETSVDCTVDLINLAEFVIQILSVQR